MNGSTYLLFKRTAYVCSPGPVSSRVLSNSKGPAKTVTKRRVEDYHLEPRVAVMHDILDIIPGLIKQNDPSAQVSECWWKANIPRKFPRPADRDRELRSAVHQLEEQGRLMDPCRALQHEHIRRGVTVCMAVARKNLVRLTRPYLKLQGRAR